MVGGIKQTDHIDDQKCRNDHSYNCFPDEGAYFSSEQNPDKSRKWQKKKGMIGKCFMKLKVEDSDPGSGHSASGTGDSCEMANRTGDAGQLHSAVQEDNNYNCSKVIPMEWQPVCLLCHNSTSEGLKTA